MPPKAKQAKMTQFFTPMASDKGQTLLTKFFQSNDPEENKFQYLFEREEARRQKLEQEEVERLQRIKEAEREKKREAKRQQQEVKQREFEVDQEKRWEEEQMKHQGKLIAPGLYLGSRHAAKNFEWINGHITAVLNVSGEVKNYCEGRFVVPPRPEGADELMEDEAKTPVPLIYKRITCEDATEQNLAQFWQETTAFLDAVITQGGAVLVHCREGLSRSPSTVIAFLMTRHGWSLDRAFYHVLDCNHKLRINDGFKRQLMDFEKGTFNKSTLDFFDKRTRNTRSTATPARGALPPSDASMMDTDGPTPPTQPTSQSDIQADAIASLTLSPAPCDVEMAD